MFSFFLVQVQEYFTLGVCCLSKPSLCLNSRLEISCDNTRKEKLRKEALMRCLGGEEKLLFISIHKCHVIIPVKMPKDPGGVITGSALESISHRSYKILDQHPKL